MYKYVTVLLIICYTSFTNCSKLNVPRVLLSYNYEHPSNFTLSVTQGGCYNWRSTRGSEVIVRSHATKDGCSTEAVVSAVTRSPTRQTAIILATDNLSSDSLRCDIIIDSIYRLEILTTTRELYVEEAPEEFEVRAYDDQGNEFSSLEGLEFEWQIEDVKEEQSNVAAQNVLSFLSYTESPYETPTLIGELEQRGKRGDKILIEGKQTGIARVTVSIPHAAYKNVKPISVTLMVVANLLLEPQDVYVLPGTAVPYSVLHLKHGILHPLSLQPSHYYLEVEDSSIGKMLDDGITVLSNEYGQTKVILYDKNVKNTGNIKQPTANYHVVEPGYLTIEVDPSQKTSLIIGKENAFHVHHFDKFNNRILLLDNVKIDTHVPKEYFSVSDRKDNGTFVFGVPIKEGKMTVTATLSEILVGDTVQAINPPLTASRDVLIYRPIAVVPKITILPYDPISQTQHSVDMLATGGSGHVLWTSSNPDVASISNTGHVITNRKGNALITAAMQQNTENFDTGEIHIVEMLDLSLVEFYKEAIVGEVIELGIGASAALSKKKYVPFTDCHMLPYAITDMSHDFQALSNIRSPVLDKSCATFDVIGEQIGFSGVKVSYRMENGEDLTVTTTVGAYKPLKAIIPEDGVTVLAPYTGRVLHFEGGPLPWILKPADYFISVSFDKNSIVSYKLLSSDDSNAGFKVFVECDDLGDVLVTVTVGNRQSKTLPHPKQSSTTVKVVCAHPDSISLAVMPYPKEQGVPPCPRSSQSSSATVSCDENVPLLVTVRDNEGRKLDNVSSLSFQWSTDSQESLATLPLDGYLLSDEKSRDYGLLKSAGVPGSLPVKVSLVGKDAISAKLLINLINKAVLEPSTLILTNHPDSKGVMTIKQGSGHFMLSTLQEKPLKISLSQNILTVIPVKDGNHNINVIDLCLRPSKVEGRVRVASVGRVTLSVVERIELGESVEAVLTLYDSLGEILPIQKELMLPSLSTKSNIARTSFSSINEFGEAVFIVKGLKLGDTTLKGSVSPSQFPQKDTKSLTAMAAVQVYPPLNIEPKVVTLVVGAQYQITAFGGPYPDGRIEFHSSNTTICEVGSVSGLITASVIGTTTVQAVAKPSHSGDDHPPQVTRSNDFVTVHVIPLVSIAIEAPTTTLETNTSMPLHVISQAFSDLIGAKLTPMSYASASPVLNFHWSSSNKQVATLGHLLDDNEISTAEGNAGMTRVFTHSAGVAIISVRVEVSVKAKDESVMQISGNEVLSAKLQLSVLESLSLKSPASQYARVLLSPGAEYNLVTNKDAQSQMRYSISECSSDVPLVSLSSNGVLTASQTTGHTTVTVAATGEYGVEQRAALLVEVKDVLYMQSSMERVMSLSKEGKGSLGAAPVGVSFPLSLSYHDNVGRRFDAVTGHASATSSRIDLSRVASVSNSSLVVSVRAEGQTVVTLQHHFTTNVITNYLRIASETAVMPQQVCVTVGQPLHFSCAVRDSAGNRGYWHSDSSSISVDRDSGLAIAVTAGKSVISYASDSTSPVTVMTEVEVLPVTALHLSVPSDSLTDGVSLSVPLKLSGDCQQNSQSKVQFPSNISPSVMLSNIKCTLSLTGDLPDGVGGLLSSAFETVPAYVPSKGYQCVVKALTPHCQWLADLHHQQSQVVMRLEATTAGAASDSVPLLFMPGVRLNTSTSNVVLTHASPASTLSLTGPVTALEKLTVSSSDVVSVRLGAVTPLGGGVGMGERTLTLEAKAPHWLSTAAEEGATSSLSLLSPLTGQTLTLTVQTEGTNSSLPGQDNRLSAFLRTTAARYQTHLFTVLCVILTAASLAVGYQALFGSVIRQGQQSVFNTSTSQAPTPAAPCSPNTSSFSSSFMSSPSPAINLWSRDSVYGAPGSLPPQRMSPRKL